MASKYNRILEEEVDVARFTKSWSDLQVIEKKLKNKAILSSHMKALSNVEQEIHRSLCEGSVPNQKLVDKLRDVYISTPKYREIQQQTALLLATCEWRLGNVERALSLLKESVSPPSFTEGGPPHLLQFCKLQAQGHAVLGLCCEHTTEKEAAIKSYQNAMQWLAHLSRLIEQQTRGLSAVHGADIFLPEINMAIAQGCMLLLEKNQYREAVAFCRAGVQLHECPLFLVLREISSLCLANTLVFHSSGNNYAPPPAEPRPPTFQKIPVPSSADEETILVLTLLLNHPLPPDANLSAIQHQFCSYASASDLLLVEYTGCSLKKAAVCMAEANLPFTAVSHSPWVDYFLASLSQGKNPAKLSMVTKEVMKEVTDSPSVLLFAVKTALTIAQQPIQAMEWCMAWIDRPTNPAFLPVAHLAVASAALQLHRQFATSSGGEDYYIRQASEHIEIAVSLDPRNVDLIFKQAIVLGERRQLRDSRSLARSALQIDPTHPGVTHLLAIMLTGEKKLKEALSLLEFALTHWKRDFGLRMSQISLVHVLQGSQAALEVCRQVLHTDPAPHDSTGGGSGVPHIVVGSSSSSGSHLEGSDIIGSSYSSSGSAINQSAKLWCKTAEIFLSCEKHSDAEDSIKEAQQLSPNTTEVLLLTGLLNEAQGRPQDAIAQYKLAIVMNPRHPQPHVAMGQILLKQGEILESKRHLKQAMEVEPKNQVIWCLMGQIYAAQKNHRKATECFSTSLTLEQSSPCLPMSNISEFM